jgi:hypothetical protein
LDTEPNPDHPRGRPRKLVWFPLLALIFVAPAIYSWIQMARLPSNEPIGVRSVEWVRRHHFSWFVDDAERYYYSWFKAPHKGGPGLTNCSATTTNTTDCFPSVGITTP